MKTIISVMCVLALTGCASTDRVPYSQIKGLIVNCNLKDEQQRFLNSQLTTPNVRYVALVNYSMDPDTQQAILDRSYDLAIRSKLSELHQCSNVSEFDIEQTMKYGCPEGGPTPRVYGRPDLNSMGDCVHDLND